MKVNTHKVELQVHSAHLNSLELLIHHLLCCQRNYGLRRSRSLPEEHGAMLRMCPPSPTFPHPLLSSGRVGPLADSSRWRVCGVAASAGSDSAARPALRPPWVGDLAFLLQCQQRPVGCFKSCLCVQIKVFFQTF